MNAEEVKRIARELGADAHNAPLMAHPNEEERSDHPL